jgi:DNA polymerase delta subunit 1
MSIRTNKTKNNKRCLLFVIIFSSNAPKDIILTRTVTNNACMIICTVKQYTSLKNEFKQTCIFNKQLYYMNVFIYDWKYKKGSIDAFGMDEQNNTVYLKFLNVRLLFYVEIPTDYPNYLKFNDFVSRFKNALLERYSHVNPIVIDNEIHYKRKLYYYHMQKPIPCLKIYTNARMYSPPVTHVSINDVPYKLNYYGVSIDPILQFVCEYDIPICSWINLDTDHEDVTCIENKEKKSNCVYEYQCKTPQITRVKQHINPPQPMVMSFDIEVYSDNYLRFPEAKRLGDVIFQISCVFYRGDCLIDKYLLTLGRPQMDVLDGCKVQTFPNELKLIIGYMKLLQEMNPSVIIGYNILRFDLPYILDRMHILNSSDNQNPFNKWSMIKNDICPTVIKEWQSSAYGKQIFKYPGNSGGRIFIDLLTVVKRDFKFDHYTLDFVSNHFLGSTKDPITHRDIFKSYETGVLGDSKDDSLELALVGKYCVKDSDLVSQLFNHLDIWLGVTESANVCNIVAYDVYTRGQQNKVFSQVYRYCYDNEILCEKKEDRTKHSFEGATVRLPKAGIFENVCVYDFASLYPSIIIAMNIDFSTLILDSADNGDLSPDDYKLIEWYDNASKQTYSFKFTKKYPGILPTIIQNLLTARAQTRQKIKETTDESIKAVLHQRQLSYKVSANSMYGILGASTSPLPLIEGAMCITARGRQFLDYAKEVLETQYEGNVIYQDTDSCYTCFPKKTTSEMWEHGRFIEKDLVLKSIFPEPVRLEFEDVYKYILALTPKRYLYTKLNKDATYDLDDIKGKGVLLCRRDNSQFSRIIYQDVVKQIFKQQNFNTCLDYIFKYMYDVYISEFEDSRYIITKTVKNPHDYKIKPMVDNPQNRKKLKKRGCTFLSYMEYHALPAHIQLAVRMKNRGINIDEGQRLEYIVVGHENGLYVEDPVYRRSINDIFPIDTLYYVKSLVKPLDQLLLVSFCKYGRISDMYDTLVGHHKCMKKIKQLPSIVYDS